MSRALASALALALMAAVLPTAACTRDNCNETGWSRFVATLSGTPSPASLSCFDPPTEQPQALTGQDGGVCAPAASDAVCILCAKASCCSAVVACMDDPACNAPTDPAYAAAVSCLSDHCADECPRLR